MLNRFIIYFAICTVVFEYTCVDMQNAICAQRRLALNCLLDMELRDIRSGNITKI